MESINIPIFANDSYLSEYNITEFVKQAVIYKEDDRQLLKNCTLCPRECRVNRFARGSGYCGMNADLNIASICIHRGEEPVISGSDGICNIFFSGCNLHCIYCQNHEISHKNSFFRDTEMEIQTVLDRISDILSTGITSVGFVSPSHMVPQMRAIISGLHSRGLRPTIVYNTNSYEKVETIKSLEDLVDVYLPDYKYVTPEIAEKFSDAPDYPLIALKAIREMYYQKGSTLRLDDNGMAENGMLIRHLVLPGHVEESRNVLISIAEELSTGVHLSLMSQYHPTSFVRNHSDLSRTLYKDEYDAVVEAMEDLGFRNGWVQDMDSYQDYLPDFTRENPFG
jgi:putative pyruvate formate lyase activating enzyme